MMPKLWNETIEAHCRVDLRSISQEQDVVARWKFFIRAGIDDIRVFRSMPTMLAPSGVRICSSPIVIFANFVGLITA